MPITRKLSSWTHSCEIQDEGLNSSSVSAGLQMAGEKNIRRKHIAFPQLLSGFSVSPGSATATCICRGLHLQTAAQHPPVPSSKAFCTGGRQISHTASPRIESLLWCLSHTSNGFLLFALVTHLLNPRSFLSSTCSAVTTQDFSSPSDQAHREAAYRAVYMWWWVCRIMEVLMKLLDSKIPFLFIRNIHLFKIQH